MVMIECRANKETIFTSEVPQSLCPQFGMDDDVAAWRPHGCGVEVERSVYCFPR